MSQITLTAPLRSNLLSLQQISKLQDKTQLLLASGLKVNSAIDNPSSYYTAQSLSSRANDLSALLDAMGQGVQTIKAATEGIEKAEDLLKQMKAVAEQTESPRVPEKNILKTKSAQTARSSPPPKNCATRLIPAKKQSAFTEILI